MDERRTKLPEVRIGQVALPRSMNTQPPWRRSMQHTAPSPRAHTPARLAAVVNETLLGRDICIFGSLAVPGGDSHPAATAGLCPLALPVHAAARNSMR